MVYCRTLGFEGMGWSLDCCWWKTKKASNWTLAGNHAWFYTVALAKKSYFSRVIASERSCPVGLFHVLWGLLQSGPMVVGGEHSAACCDLFAN